MPDKSIIWLGSSRRDLQAFAALARRLKTSANDLRIGRDRFRALKELA
jgi:hypothetical protein